MTLTKLALCLALAALLPACRSPYYANTPVAAQTQDAAPPPMYEWHGDDTPGSLSIRISLSDQTAQLYKGGQNVGWTYVATGLEGHRTPAGKYSVLEKIVDKVSNRYGVIVNGEGQVVDDDASPGRERVPAGCRYVPASMPYWMRVTHFGIGMHAGYIPEPGKPASHGCIRLPAEMAQILFQHAVVGTPVTISP